MRILYNTAIYTYGLAIQMAALWNPKARKWVQGRQGSYWSDLAQFARENPSSIWFHCASLGEFEQVQRVLELAGTNYGPRVVTFSSPSGYESRKDTPLAEGVFYLPLDLPRRARKFIHTLKPRAGVLVKYEIWLNLIDAATVSEIPLALVAAQFQPNQIYFRWWGGAFRRALGKFHNVGVQDDLSAKRLHEIGVDSTITGDPRVDRVVGLPSEPFEDAFLARFSKETCVVAGSAWGPELDLLNNWRKKDRETRLMIAPHELSKDQLEEIQRAFPDIVSWNDHSGVHAQLTDANVPIPPNLLIDRFGVLNKIYRYGAIAMVGGGFKTGLHNILEPASYGIPVIFGPRHQRFPEAQELIDAGGAFSVKNQAEFNLLMKSLIQHPERRREAGKAARNYVVARCGAAEKTKMLIHALCAEDPS